jgi:hypothetical protein
MATITTTRRGLPWQQQQQQLVRVSAAAAAAVVATPLLQQQQRQNQQQFQQRRGFANHRVRTTTPLFLYGFAWPCVALEYIHVLNHI